MNKMIDLALGRPATQSSKHPDFVLPLEQIASEGVSPDDQDSSFHTAAEWFPWWQVDLERPCSIDRILLINTDYWPVRNRMFTILVSMDGKAWDEVFSKTDHRLFGSSAEEGFEVNLDATVCARFVRVRLDNWDYLHLKSVRVFGQELDGEHRYLLAAQPPSAVSPKVVFAANYNEEDEFLPVYLQNFLNFTDENCFLVVNFPSGRTIPPHPLLSHNRIHVFNGRVERKKWGGTLLLGHMESYGEALHIFSGFEYFCTCASNGLFIRPFKAAKAVQHVATGALAPVGMTRHYLIDVPLEDIPRGEAWVWDNLQEAEPFRRYLIDEADISLISINQIEGLFADREEWDALYQRISVLRRCDGYFANPTQKTLALEEFLPVTFFRRFAKGEFTNICHMLWEPIRELTFPDLLEFTQKLPAHMCQVKWFSRNPDSIPTAALSNGWSRDLLADLAREKVSGQQHNRILNRALTAHYNAALRALETYTPLTRAWRSDARWGRVQWMGSQTITHETDRIIKGGDIFSGLPLTAHDRGAAWIRIAPRVERETRIEAMLAEDGATTTLHLDAVPQYGHPGEHGWSEAWAVLFLSALQDDRAEVFRISLIRPFEHSHEQLLMNVRRSNGSNDEAWLPILQEDDGDKRHFYYLRPECQKGEIWLGIPMFHSTSIKLELSFGIAPV
ncbi:discoidin domain-containing protein [Asaia bogorensis]|uniref:discoidin domain-containing protein n=1 Tax=Asaia bogorensis TaxID=91915 RepID=UPI000EFCF989|nr:discoidin domain-containing protein [Asaia bogorensis]